MVFGKGGKAMVGYHDPDGGDACDEDMPPGLTGDDGEEPYMEEGSSHQSTVGTTADEETGGRFEDLRRVFLSKHR